MSEKKQKIIDYLKQGIPLSKIANFKDIKCSRSYTYKVAAEAEKNGLIIKDDRLRIADVHGRPKQELAIYKSTGEDFTDSRWGGKFSRFHHIRLYYDIEAPLIKKPAGKTIKLKNGVTQTSFRVNQGKYHVTFMVYNEKRLVVAVSEEMDAKNFSMISELETIASDAAAWFQRNYGGSLSLPLIKEKPHIAVREDDPRLIELMKDVERFDTGTSWYDRSKGYLEFETTEEEILKIKASEPEILKQVMEDHKWLFAEVKKLQNEIGQLSALLRGPRAGTSGGVEGYV
jgi:hypothetical protein